MVWTRNKSLERIAGFRQSVPTANVQVQSLGEKEVAARLAKIRMVKESFGRDEDLIFNVGQSQAVLAEGVHIYLHLIDHHQAMMEQGRETEASHARVLAMLHLHYAGCDRVLEAFEAQRVDYHGARLHAVVLSPGGTQGTRERALRALALAEVLKRTIEASGQQIGGGFYNTRVRIGLDSGPAVAVNSGRGDEPEPLFLGRPANYAAKLAEGDEAGIFVSDRIRHDLALPLVESGLIEERRQVFSSDTIGQLGKLAHDSGIMMPTGDDDIKRTVESLQKAPELGYLAENVKFAFHRHEPPLRSIDFSELMPSNSIRMELTSVFADIDGFTAYVDSCIAQHRIQEMVANLHVLRSELAASLKHDFGGRKARFVGDCLHGLLAEGTRTETNESDTVAQAVKAAGGLRSSFELCQQELPSIEGLGLAIGIELGATPVTRLGIRGDRSVRCATSAAVSASEICQRGCAGNETALGPRALAAAPASIRRLFQNGKARNLDFDSIDQHVSAPAIISSGNVARVAQSHSQ